MAFNYRLVFDAASVNSISLLQTRVGAGALLINGALAQSVTPNDGGTLDFNQFNRTVTITSTGNLSGVNFTITGTKKFPYDPYKVVTETIAGPNNNTVSTTGLFNRVLSITTSGTVGTAVSVGTGVTGATSNWCPVGGPGVQFNVGMAVVVTGTINYTVNHTFDDIYNPNITPVAFPHDSSVFVNATASAASNYVNPCRASEIVINSGTGSLTFTIIQDGLVS